MNLATITIRLTLLVTAPIALVACGTDIVPPRDVLPNMEIPPAPSAGEGWQIITPIYKDLAPGKDIEMCTWTDVTTDDLTDVVSTLGFQTEPPGHHVIVFYTLTPQPPQTRECTDSDMATFRFLTGGAPNGTLNQVPDGLVYRIPKGAQIILQHHYLNSTTSTISGQSVVNVNFAPHDASLVQTSGVAFLDSSINVPVGDTAKDIHCVIDRTLKVWSLLPHMHQWGKHINVDVTQAGVKSRKFDEDWDPSYAFHPPVIRLDPSEPMTLNAGDAVDVHCEWFNDQTHSLPFGLEMCVSFGQFVDDQTFGSIACDGGSWVPF